MEEIRDVKIEQVSLGGHVKAIAIAVMVILLMSMSCVLGYHYLVTKSLEDDYNGKFQKMSQNISLTVETLMGMDSDIEKNILDLRSDMNKIMYTQTAINGFVAEIMLVQSEKVQTLERRHLEVIRALAILQKNHWTVEKRLESSGWGVGVKSFDWEAFLKAAKTPEGKSIKDSEKVIENW